VSPSWISTSGTCSVASSELIIFPGCRCDRLPTTACLGHPKGLSRHRASVNAQMLSFHETARISNAQNTDRGAALRTNGQWIWKMTGTSLRYSREPGAGPVVMVEAVWPD
jgi:hypothetical protein